MSWNFDSTLICNNSKHFRGWVTLYLLKNCAFDTLHRIWVVAPAHMRCICAAALAHMRCSSSSYAAHMRCTSSSYATGVPCTSETTQNKYRCRENTQWAGTSTIHWYATIANTSTGGWPSISWKIALLAHLQCIKGSSAPVLRLPRDRNPRKKSVTCRKHV